MKEKTPKNKSNLSIAYMVKKITNPPKEVASKTLVDSELLIPLKNICKSNDMAQLGEVFHYLSTDLISKKNGLYRLRSLFTIDYVFMRSRLFRSIVCNHINIIIRCAGLLRTQSHKIDNDIASSYVKEVEEKVKELIEIWDLTFGEQFSQLKVVARYLRESLKLKMPNLQVRYQVCIL